jgi:hypothetical protein
LIGHEIGFQMKKGVKTNSHLCRIETKNDYIKPMLLGHIARMSSTKHKIVSDPIIITITLPPTEKLYTKKKRTSFNFANPTAVAPTIPHETIHVKTLQPRMHDAYYEHC